MLEQQAREQRQDLSRDAGILNPIVSAGTGGLNLVDGALKTALSDSMLARNVVVGNDGVLRRRPGTRDLGRVALSTITNPRANYTNHAVVTTPNGHDFVILRLGITMAAWNLLPDDRFGSYRIQPNTNSFVLPSGVGEQEGSMTVLRDPRIRVITTVPGCPPLETRVNELRVTGNGTNSITIARADIEGLIPGVYEQQDIIERQFVTFVNGEPLPIQSWSQDGTNITFTFTNTYSSSSLFDIVFFQSYWWAEAEMYYGDRFSDSVIRTNLDEEDVHVAIPSNLRDGMEQRGTDPRSEHTIDALYWNGSTYSRYTQVSDGTPDTVTQFALSDGSARIDDSPVIPSPLFMTFGEYEPEVVRPVTLHRHRRLNHRGGGGIVGPDLEVYVDGQGLVFTGTTSGNTFGLPAFRLWNDNDTAQITNVTTKGSFISIDGQWSTRPELNPSSVVRIISPTSQYAPSAVKRVPAYGFTTVCDYERGSFPSCSATYQNRLVMAGMPHDPLLVAFSALFDSRTPEEPYMYFQNDPLDLNPATSAFQVRLDSTADDRIVALEEFQGSLFAITYRGVFRIAAPGRTVITSDNFFVSSVASVGAVSANSVCRPEGGIAFLSPRGLFAIVNGVQSNEATEYKLVELSTKIASLFDSSLSERGSTRLWWTSYASEERRIYIGLTQPGDKFHTSRMFTYDMLNQAWNEMDTVGGFRVYHGFNAQLARDSSYHFLLTDIYTDGDFYIVGTGREHHLDFQRDISSGDAVTYSAPRMPTSEPSAITTSNGTVGRIYKVNGPMSPLTGAKDIRVFVGVEEQEPFTGYVKLPGGYIYLLGPLTQGASTIIQVVHTNGTNAPLSVTSQNSLLSLVNDGLAYDEEDWTLNTETATYNQAEWTHPDTFTRDVTVGVIFQSVWVSPVVTLGDITQDKRLEAVTIYMERRPQRRQWYGSFTEYNDLSWPTNAQDEGAGSSLETLDVTLAEFSAEIGIVTDQDQNENHPLHLTTERDFLTLDEPTPNPDTLQRALGLAIRRSFTDVVSVFQLALTSRGSQSFGLSAFQVEADLKRSKQVNRSR
jgi:hypothetical protein